ncbi:hypothetical protein ACSX1A_13060 [Pontibacter sp. MBLB2868]|uniref:hypothetical protein n=1 Tax=Pontibacter sp. MBLB2868 TaxID=3451555 RepID=UPI003F74CE15
MMNIHSKRTWLLVALLNLVVVAFMGLLLRWMFVGTLAGVNYKFLLHAHSHVALLGWLYSAVSVTLLVTFLPPKLHAKKTYTWQFWLSQVAVAGMLLSFPVQGYAAVSITFSTAHILLSYWFIYQFLKDARSARQHDGEHRLSFRFVVAALFFLALSSLGPWAMGPIMALGHSGGALYYNAIYFYLHFQYNGWFTFAVLALFFWLLEHYRIPFSMKWGKVFFKLMFWAAIPAYLLSVLWTKPDAVVYMVSGVAGVAQLAAVYILFMMLLPAKRQLVQLFGRWSRALFILAAGAFTLKILLQFSTAFPYMADLAYRIRFFIIGYLHLVLIGFVSFFVFAFLAQRGWLSFKGRLSRWGMGAFVMAFTATEVLLFLQGGFFWLGLGAIPGFHLILFGVSILLPVGISVFFLAQLLAGKRQETECKPRPMPELQKVYTLNRQAH